MTGYDKCVFHMACILSLFLSTTALAGPETWSSPDGAISVAVPDLTRFQVYKPISSPEVVMGWQSTDKTITMLITEMPKPQGAVLILPAVVQGFETEAKKTFKNVLVLDSSEERRGGNVVLVMSLTGERDEGTMYVTQILTSTNTKCYKAIVAGFEIDTRTNPDAVNFIASFKPLKRIEPAHPTPPNSGQKTGQPTEDPKKDNPAYNIGYFIGRVGCLLFIPCVIALIVLVVFLVSRNQRENDRPRRRRRPRDEDDYPDEDDRPRRRRRPRDDDED